MGPKEKRAPGWRCCFKTTIKAIKHSAPTTTAGVLHPNATHLEAAPQPGNVTFSEFYDIAKDPWQMKNLWPSLSPGKQAALMAEIDRRFACAGTRESPSTCE